MGELNELKEQHFFDPELLFDKAGITAGMTVADFGCGRDATIVKALAQRVGEHGRIYALDIVKDVLYALVEQMKLAHIKNVQVVWTDLEVYGAARGILDETLDAGLLLTTLFYSRSRLAMMKECARMLKHAANLLVMDWKPETQRFGPPLEHRASAVETKKIGGEVGLVLVEEFVVSEYHWGLLFKK